MRLTPAPQRGQPFRRKYPCPFCALAFRRPSLRAAHVTKGAANVDTITGCATTRAEAARPAPPPSEGTDADDR